ncbi:MAG: peptidoglycan DD-metalloendopeptidase family protein [Candidatus Moranbacteria bacterium]|nr:peptidoglycan DD-metalloendopeptidase family protein [Candidatus Moranbacteria bacterium]
MLQIYKKIQSAFFLAILLSGGLASSLLVVRAACTTSDITCLEQESQEKADDLKDELESIDAKIKAYKQIVDLKQRQGATLADQIEGLQAQVDQLQLEIDVTTKQISTLEKQISTLTLRIAEKSVLIDRQKRILSELMRVYYSDYSGDVTPTILTSAESLLYFKKESWTANMSDKVSEILESVKTLRSGLTNEQAQLTVKKDEVGVLYQDLALRNQSIETAKNSKAVLLGKTQAEETKYEGLVDKLQKERDDIENEIADLESGLSTEGLPSYSKGTLAYPVKKVTISQNYGKTKFSKNAYASGKHNGIDFAGSYGTAILAAASGKVIGTGNLGKYAYGRWAAIDHGNGIVTLYGHMSSVGVSTGDKVDKGEQIGKMGSTGYSTGNHLHFTVFSADSYELAPSATVRGLKIPIGASVNPTVYLP